MTRRDSCLGKVRLDAGDCGMEGELRVCESERRSAECRKMASDATVQLCQVAFPLQSGPHQSIMAASLNRVFCVFLMVDNSICNEMRFGAMMSMSVTAMTDSPAVKLWWLRDLADGEET